MKVKETPFEKYPRIEEDAWDEFMPLKTSDEFTNRSEAASKLVKSSSCPHKMGTDGYVGMSKIQDKEDDEARSKGCEPVLSHIKDTGETRWSGTRILSCDEVMRD
jgi:hypothetical protein